MEENSWWQKACVCVGGVVSGEGATLLLPPALEAGFTPVSRLSLSLFPISNRPPLDPVYGETGL